MKKKVSIWSKFLLSVFPLSRLHCSVVLAGCNTLGLSEAAKEKVFMLSKISDWNPVCLMANDGKQYNMICSNQIIGDLLINQPSGKWLLPKLTATSDIEKGGSSCGDLFGYIASTSPISGHLSKYTYTELKREMTEFINQDWTFTPQLKYATSQLFSGAILVENSTALLINCVEPYGRLKSCDAHFERRLASSREQSSYPLQETKYGWINTISVNEDQVKKKN